MFRILILFWLMLSSVLLCADIASDINYEKFNSYEDAISYIKKSSKKATNTQKKPIKQAVIREKKPNPPTLTRSSISKNIRNTRIKTSCRRPRVSIDEFYTKDAVFHSFNDGSQIRYKYSFSDREREFLLILKDFKASSVNDTLLEDKKRFVIKPVVESESVHKKLVDIDGVKRLELSVVQSRRDKMFIVFESDEGSLISKCEIFLQKKGGSSLYQFTAKKVKSGEYNFVYKLYLYSK